MIKILVLVLGAFAVVYIGAWIWLARQASADGKPTRFPSLVLLAIGFVTDFLDTLGIGSFAVTTTMYKLGNLVSDGDIPGTMNVGHTLPTICEALIFLAIVTVDAKTLLAMIAAAVVGAWVGAGIVSKLPQQKIRVGLGVCLVVAAALMYASMRGLLPGGGAAVGLTGVRFGIGVAGNFVLGALMPLGIGLYAPCMILVSLLGMNPIAAFPIMMGSCAFLMPVGSTRFLKSGRLNPRAALGLAVGGIPGVLIAAYLVKSLPLNVIRWLVIAVVLYAAYALLRSALDARRASVAAVAGQ